MNSAIAEGYRRLEGVDRLLLYLMCSWVIVGTVGNYYRVYRPIEWVLALLFWPFVVILLSILGGTIYSLFRSGRTPRDYGFVLNGGGLWSLAIIAGVYVYLLLGRKLALSFSVRTMGLPVATAIMEEVGFRAILIDNLGKIFVGVRRRGVWVVLGSTVLFSIPHIPSKTPLQLQGIVSGSLILAAIYYKSRSILLPAWIHAASNTGHAGGILAVMIYCCLGLADRLLAARRVGSAPAHF